MHCSLLEAIAQEALQKAAWNHNNNYLGEEWYGTFSAKWLSFIPRQRGLALSLYPPVYAVNSPQSRLGLATQHSIAVEVAI